MVLTMLLIAVSLHSKATTQHLYKVEYTITEHFQSQPAPFVKDVYMPQLAVPLSEPHWTRRDCVKSMVSYRLHLRDNKRQRDAKL